MINSDLVTSAGTDILTVGTGQNIAVVNIVVCNYTTNTATVDIYAVPSGDSVDNTTKIVSARSLRGNDSLFLNMSKILLSAGDKIHVKASADNTINAMISYTVI